MGFLFCFVFLLFWSFHSFERKSTCKQPTSRGTGRDSGNKCDYRSRPCCKWGFNRWKSGQWGSARTGWDEGVGRLVGRGAEEPEPRHRTLEGTPCSEASGWIWGWKGQVRVRWDSKHSIVAILEFGEGAIKSDASPPLAELAWSHLPGSLGSGDAQS